MDKYIILFILTRASSASLSITLINPEYRYTWNTDVLIEEMVIDNNSSTEQTALKTLCW